METTKQKLGESQMLSSEKSPAEFGEDLERNYTRKVDDNRATTCKANDDTEPCASSSSTCEEDECEHSKIVKEFLFTLSREREQRQCTLRELWCNCADCSLGEKLSIFCDWAYANVSAKFVLICTTAVPVCAWYTRLFWEALISHLLLIFTVWMFTRFVFAPQTTATISEAEKLDRQLFEQSVLHRHKLSKILDAGISFKNEIDVDNVNIEENSDLLLDNVD